MSGDGVKRMLAMVAAGVFIAVACTPAPRSPVAEPQLPTTGRADPATVALSILAPGNGNASGLTARFGDDQRARYDAIENAVADGTLTDGNLGGYFKDNRLDAAVYREVDRPRPGVVVSWDTSGVPHVDGESADDVAFGAGWAVAESRLIVAEAGRLLGRAGALEMGGPDLLTAVKLIGHVPQINYTDEELEAALDAAVADAGSDGIAMRSAIDSFVAGINSWLDTNTFPPEAQALGLRWRHWTRADVLAVGVVVDDIFGAGGGDEVGNAAALDALVDQLGPTAGRAVFSDFRTGDDPSATNHVTTRFDYPVFADPVSVDPGEERTTNGLTNDRQMNDRASPANEVDPAAVALPDAGGGALAQVRHLAETPTMSNYLVLDGTRTRSGHPILVGGPQSSYFFPELLFEMELHGGGYDSRGITFPGLGPWVVIGRSRTYAWTATAGGSDLTDQRVERLCEPGGSAPTLASDHYLFDGQCRSMSRPDDDPMTAYRTVHGPVVGRSTVDGAPVAISRQRMSRFQTAHAAPAFWKLNRGVVVDSSTFAPTMSVVPMSFNWMYVNASDVAYFHSGWYPIRARGVDPDLPSWGTGEWEWQGRLDPNRQPQEVDAPTGVSASWNNKVAPGWRESDNDWDAGVVQRVDTILQRGSLLRDATPADAVRAVQDAATVDVRGALVLPELLAVLGSGTDRNPDARRARDALTAWVVAGAHRRDRDDNGWYDDRAVALMDEFYPRAIDAVFGPRLGRYMSDTPSAEAPVRRPRLIDNPPSQTGGAYAHGWYSILVRDLRRASGVESTPGSVPVFCGGGSLERCRNVLWDALYAAQLAVGPLPKPTIFERIRFIPYLNGASVRWMNRPTYQQVISFG